MASLTLGKKLLLILLFPLLIISYFLIQSVDAKQKLIATSVRVKAYAELAVTLNSLSHELQMERGYSSSFLGSQRRLFFHELLRQRDLVDLKRRELSEFTKTIIDQNLNVMVKSNLDKIDYNLLILSQVRDDVSALKTTFEGEFSYFSNLNLLIGQTIQLLSRNISDVDMSRELESYGYLTFYKEAKAQERGTVLYALSVDRVEYDVLKKIIGIAVTQDIYFRNFQQFATDDQMHIFKKSWNEETEGSIEEVRRAFINKINRGPFKIDPNYWTILTTKNINNLHLASQKMATRLKENANHQLRKAKRSFFFEGLILAVFGALTVLLSYLLVRSILDPLREGISTLSQVSEGKFADLSLPTLRSKGEISQLVQTLNEALLSLSLKSRNLKEMAMLAEFHPDPIFSIDSSGSIVLANRAALDLFSGDDEKQLIGRSWDFVVPDCPLQLRDQFKYPEITIKNRSLVLISKQILELGLTYVYFTDVTELREQELKTKMYMAAVDAANEAIMLVKSDGTIFHVSPGFTQLTGNQAKDVIGQNPKILKSGVQNQEFYKNLWDTINSEQTWSSEIIDKKKDGSLFNAKVTIAPFTNISDGSKSFACLLTDISKVKQLENSLRQAASDAEKSSKFKSVFLANMSHEIRTPMNAILGMASLLSETDLTSEQRRYLNIFNTSGRTLLNLINDILDLSRVEAGQLVLDRHVYSLKEVADQVVTLMKPLVHDKSIEMLCTHRISEKLYLKGDSHRLKQILLNLIGNAIKFTKQGKVYLKIEEISKNQDKMTILFSVEDTGIGISEEKKNLIFESFNQGDASKAREYGGTGLGLAISKSLVTLMGGKIWVESEVGKGSTFFFTIQSEYLDEEAAKKILSRDLHLKEVTSSIRNFKKKVRVLLADDSDDNRILIQAYFKNLPIEVDYVHNGKEAVERFLMQDYQIILMDIQMPVMNGYEAISKIRALEKDHGKSRTPIIALTAHALKEDREKSVAAGCDAHLTKPIEKGTLISTLERFI
ncbi:MAG: hypothetical protein A2Z20_00975 [Bdellovibrionales bacterium RBG_16_40_8]|nr:MAG: hypothetical protein A2Z20_00975 [Bdellovibrionales bacterium RBG_16_40_8]